MTDIPIKPRFVYALEAARNFLMELEICSLPVDPFRLATQLDLGPIPFSQVNLDLPIDGFIQRNRFQLQQIFYNDFISSLERIRFTVMHEIAHFELGHLNYPEALLTKGGIADEPYGVLEVEANFFASEVLAPTAVLKALNIQSVPEIMKLCRISEDAACKRIERLQNQDRWHLFKEIDQTINKQFNDFLNEKYTPIHR